MPRRSHSRWVLKYLSDAKDMAKEGTGVPVPREWGALALHHKISKVHLDWIEVDLQEALGSKDVELAKAAKQFWGKAQEAAGRQVVRDADSMQKILWNMPLNVEIGPEAVAEDPGTRLDPNTEPIPEDGEGGRRLTAESAALQSLEHVYLTARHGNRSPDEDEWNRMTESLKVAIHAHNAFADGYLLAPPRHEQWLKQTGDDADDGQRITWQRKRLRRFPGAAQGVKSFQKGRKLGEPLDTTVNGLMPAALVQQHQFQDFRGQQYTLILDVQPSALRHMCQRHTYQHFSFDQAKLVNTFWPVTQVAGAAAKHAAVTAALPKIAQAAFEIMELDEILDDWGGAKLTGISVPINNGTVFFIATVEVADDANSVGSDGSPDQWVVHLKTVAPDGDSAQAFTEAELKQIRQQL